MGALSQAIRYQIDSINKTSAGVSSNLDQRLGNVLVSLTPDVVYQRLGQAIDMDSIRGLLDQAVKYSLRDVTLQVNKIQRDTEQILSHMDRIIASLDLGEGGEE